MEGEKTIGAKRLKSKAPKKTVRGGKEKNQVLEEISISPYSEYVDKFENENNPPWSTENTISNIKDIEVAKKMLKINQSANDRNLEYDLSFLTVKRLMSYKKCYYTGKEFKEDGLFARSFDRVDSSKGYIEGNVVACTVDINQKKTNLSVEEITILYNKLVLKIN